MADLTILDMDGVLLHLDLRTEKIRASIKRLFAEAGVSRDFVPLNRKLEQTCEELARDEPDRAESLRRAAWRLIDEEELRAAQRCRVASGAHALLDAIEGPVALFTNNHLEAADRALRRVGIAPDRFVAVQTRTGPRSIKPSAAPIVSIVENTGPYCREDRVFVVGDHPADMQSVELARESLGLTDGERPQLVPIGIRGDRDRELERAGAWFLAADLAEVGILVQTPRCSSSLSMVLLAYNEEEVVERAVLDARRFGKTYLEDHEIIVVDDGSTDETARRVRALAGDDLRLEQHHHNRGMGAAMRTGYLAAEKEYIAHLPGDRQVRPQALAVLLEHTSPDRVVLTHYHTPHSGGSRGWVSVVFRMLARHVGGLSVDFAGTYIFHRKWLDLLHDRRVRSGTFLLSYELLRRLVASGCAVTDIGIHNFPRETGVSRELTIPRVARMLVEIVRSRLRSSLARLP